MNEGYQNNGKLRKSYHYTKKAVRKIFQTTGQSLISVQCLKSMKRPNDKYYWAPNKPPTITAKPCQIIYPKHN